MTDRTSYPVTSPAVPAPPTPARRFSSPSPRWLAAAALLSTVLSASPLAAGADTPAGPVVTLNGFGTLGLARSSTDDAQYVRDLGQPSGLTRDWTGKLDSVLGLQANFRLGHELNAVVQAVSRYRYDDTYTPEVTWAFLRYDPSATLSLRGGRLGTEFYMLADSRMVGYSYLTIRPPVDYYGTLPFTFIDGGDLTVTHPLAGGLLRGKLFAGYSGEKVPWENRQFDLGGSLMVGGYVNYEQGAWQFRLSRAQLRFSHDLPVEDIYASLDAAVPGTSAQLRVKDKLTRFTSFGTVYDQGPVQAQFMISKTDNNHASFQDTWAGYVIGAYRLGRVTPYLGYSWARSKAKDLVYAVPPYTDQYQAEFHSDQHTIFLGGRWDLGNAMDLKAQVDWISGVPTSKFLYRWENATWNGHMTVYSVSLDFIF